MDAVEILVFIAVMGLLLYRKATGNQSKDKKPRQKRPARPVVVSEEEAEVSETVVPVKGPARPQSASLYEVASKRKTKRPAAEPKKKTATVVPSVTETSEEAVRFRTREDARRAFLYSEIFHRKYD